MFKRNWWPVQRKSDGKWSVGCDVLETTAGRKSLSRLVQVWFVDENGRLVMGIGVVVEEYRFLRPDNNNKQTGQSPKPNSRLTASGSMRQQL